MSVTNEQQKMVYSLVIETDRGPYTLARSADDKFLETMGRTIREASTVSIKKVLIYGYVDVATLSTSAIHILQMFAANNEKLVSKPDLIRVLYHDKDQRNL